jgi:hypothetical protein
MERLNDRELRAALLDPELKSRKRAYARELLRRRYDSDGRLAWRKAWIGALYWLGSTRAALSRRGSRTQ